MTKRLSAILVLDSGLVVNSYNFETHLPVGKLKHTLQRLQDFEIDEVIILNAAHTRSSTQDFDTLMKEMDSWHIATPIAFGGGITCVDDAMRIISAGAERVVVSSKLLVNSDELFKMSSFLGDQALILHLPIQIECNKAMVRGDTLISLQSVINQIPNDWGGELMFSFVASDGAKFPNWKSVSVALESAMGSKNLILAGGFSNAKDISMGLQLEQVSAIAVGNYLHRTELSVTNLKQGIDPKIELRRTK